MGSSVNIIIYECDYTGHRVNYLIHLIEYVIQNDSYTQSVLFVLGEELLNKLKNERSQLDLVNIHSLEEVYVGDPNRNKLLLKDLENIIDEIKTIEKVVLMNFDLFIYSFFKRKYLVQIAVRTIFFRPYVHFPNSNLKDKTKYFIKKLILKYVLVRNQNIEKIFILNDKKAVSLLNTIFFNQNKSDYKFYQLPDPVKNSEKLITYRRRNIDSVINFLVIGTIDEKKNVTALLQAMQSISNTSKQFKIRLTISGKIVNHFKQELLDKCSVYGVSFEIEIIDKFLTETEFENNMEISDCVFMAYKGFYSSSGILGHAISYLKPIIFSNDTLVEQMAKKYSVGFGCNPESVDSIQSSLKDVIKLLVENKFQEKYLKRRQQFVLEYSPERFCEILIR
jgi:hypothetical protein